MKTFTKTLCILLISSMATWGCASKANSNCCNSKDSTECAHKHDSCTGHNHGQEEFSVKGDSIHSDSTQTHSHQHGHDHSENCDHKH